MYLNWQEARKGGEPRTKIKTFKQCPKRIDGQDDQQRIEQVPFDQIRAKPFYIKGQYKYPQADQNPINQWCQNVKKSHIFSQRQVMKQAS